MHQSRIVLSSARALSFCIALVFLLVLAALLQGAYSNTEKEMRFIIIKTKCNQASTNQCFLAPKIGANDLAMQVQDVAKSPAPLQRPSRVAPVSFSVLT